MLVSEHGEGDVLHMVCDQVANGMKLSDICRAEGILYSVLWKWLKGKDERMAGYREALEARAELEAHRMLEIADEATVEDVAVANLRVKARQWIAGKWGKGMYGDRDEKGGGGITVVVQRGGCLTVVDGQDKGYPAVISAEDVVDGEVV